MRMNDLSEVPSLEFIIALGIRRLGRKVPEFTLDCALSDALLELEVLEAVDARGFNVNLEDRRRRLGAARDARNSIDQDFFLDQLKGFWGVDCKR